MGRAKKLKAARKVAQKIADSAPKMVIKKSFWEWLPFIGYIIRSNRERKEKIHLEAVRRSKKKIVDFVAKRG